MKKCGRRTMVRRRRRQEDRKECARRARILQATVSLQCAIRVFLARAKVYILKKREALLAIIFDARDNPDNFDSALTNLLNMHNEYRLITWYELICWNDVQFYTRLADGLCYYSWHRIREYQIESKVGKIVEAAYFQDRIDDQCEGEHGTVKELVLDNLLHAIVTANKIPLKQLKSLAITMIEGFDDMQYTKFLNKVLSRFIRIYFWKYETDFLIDVVFALLKLKRYPGLCVALWKNKRVLHKVAVKIQSQNDGEIAYRFKEMLQDIEFEELVAVAIPHAAVLNFWKQINFVEDIWLNKILPYLSNYYNPFCFNIIQCKDCELLFDKNLFVNKQDCCPFCYVGPIEMQECILYAGCEQLFPLEIPNIEDKCIGRWFDTEVAPEHNLCVSCVRVNQLIEVDVNGCYGICQKGQTIGDLLCILSRRFNSEHYFHDDCGYFLNDCGCFLNGHVGRFGVKLQDGDSIQYMRKKKFYQKMWRLAIIRIFLCIQIKKLFATKNTKEIFEVGNIAKQDSKNITTGFEININGIAGKLCTLTVTASQTIWNMKEIIGMKFDGITPDRLKLKIVDEEKDLRNHYTLAHYNIKQGDSLYLVVTQYGGGKHSATKQYNAGFDKSDNDSNVDVNEDVHNATVNHGIGSYELYAPFRKLSDGVFGDILIGTNTNTGKKIIAKCILLSNITSGHNLVQNEIKILKDTKHENIIEFYEWKHSEKEIYIFVEYCNGGDLFQYISKNGVLKRHLAFNIFNQFVNGLSYLHSNNIVHLDIKAENIFLMCKPCGGITVKIGDFGLSMTVLPGELITCQHGSVDYVAPEVLQGIAYEGKYADIWSSGVLLYFILMNKLPFRDINMFDSKRIIFQRILNGEYNIPDFVDAFASELILSMLVVDPDKRNNVDDIKRALKTPFENLSCDAVDTEVVEVKKTARAQLLAHSRRHVCHKRKRVQEKTSTHFVQGYTADEFGTTPNTPPTVKKKPKNNNGSTRSNLVIPYPIVDKNVIDPNLMSDIDDILKDETRYDDFWT